MEINISMSSILEQLEAKKAELEKSKQETEKKDKESTKISDTLSSKLLEGAAIGTNNEDLKQQSQDVAEDLKFNSKINDIYLESEEKLKEHKEKDLALFQTSSLDDIKFNSRLLVPSKENESDKEIKTSLREETTRRIAIYSKEYSNGWHTLDYSSVNLEHEMGVGLGDILLDPTIQAIEVNKNSQRTICKRGIAPNGRLGFLDENGSYMATFTGDKFRILSNDDLSELEFAKKYKEEEEARKNYKPVYEQEKLTYSVSGGPRANGEIRNGGGIENLKHNLLNYVIPRDEILAQYSPEGLTTLNEIRRLHNEFFENPGTGDAAKKNAYMNKHNQLSAKLQNLISKIPIEVRKEEIENQITYAKKVAEEFGFPPALLLAIIATESSYNPLSIHKTTTSTASGLFQFLNSTWEGKNGNGGYIGYIKQNDIWHPEWGEKNYQLSGRLNTYMMLHATARYIRGTINTINLDPRIKLDLNNIQETARLIYLGHHEGKGGAVPYQLAINKFNAKGLKTYQQIFSYYKSSPQGFDQIMKDNLGSSAYNRLYNNQRCNGSRDCSVEKFLGIYFKHANNVSIAANSLHKESITPIESTPEQSLSPTIDSDNLDKINTNYESLGRQAELPIHYKENIGLNNLARGGAPGYLGRSGKWNKEIAIKQLRGMYNKGVRVIFFLSKQNEPNVKIAQEIGFTVPDPKLKKYETGDSRFNKITDNAKELYDMVKSKKCAALCRHGNHRAGGLSIVMQIMDGAKSMTEAFNKAQSKLSDYNVDGKGVLKTIIKFAEEKNIQIDPKFYKQAGLR